QDFVSAARIAAMRLQEFRADFIADVSDVSFRLKFGDFENEFARKGVAVGVQTRGGKRQKRVAGFYILSGEQIFSLDRANDESRKIVFAGLVKAGHLRCLPADQGASGFAAGAAHAIHELLDDVRIHLAEREIIQKKKRLGALDQNVIYAVID